MIGYFTRNKDLFKSDDIYCISTLANILSAV